MAGTADPKVRLRVFNYLRTSGVQLSQANRVASRVVGAMVGSARLPESVIAIASAAISPNPTLDHMDETKSMALLEPKAEPYETGGTGTGAIGGTSVMPKFGGGLSTNIRTAAPRIGGTGGGFSAPTGGLRSPVGGGKTNFAIIEPILYRREVIGRIGTSLSRSQLQAYVAEVGRAF